MKELLEALEPFARAADDQRESAQDAERVYVGIRTACSLTVGDFRRARDAIAKARAAQPPEDWFAPAPASAQRHGIMTKGELEAARDWFKRRVHLEEDGCEIGAGKPSSPQPPEDVVERVARALYPHIVSGTNYEEVPIEEAWSRPRYCSMPDQMRDASRAALSAMQDGGDKALLSECLQCLSDLLEMRRITQHRWEYERCQRAISLIRRLEAMLSAAPVSDGEG